MWKTHDLQILFLGQLLVFHIFLLLGAVLCAKMCPIWKVPTPNLGEGLADQENVVRELDEWGYMAGVWHCFRMSAVWD